MFVEDDPHDAFLFDRALKRARPDAQLVVLCTLRAAFAYLAEFSNFSSHQVHTLPFLVAVDLTLPDGRGSDLIRWMRTQPALKDLHVIIVTGSRDPKDADEASTLHLTSFFIKPMETAQLTAWLATLPMAERAGGKPQ
jgi:CheY-like chemotaxis protein